MAEGAAPQREDAAAKAIAARAAAAAGESGAAPRALHPTLVLEIGQLARSVRRLLLGVGARAGSDDDEAAVVRRPNIALVRVEPAPALGDASSPPAMTAAAAAASTAATTTAAATTAGGGAGEGDEAGGDEASSDGEAGGDGEAPTIGGAALDAALRAELDRLMSLPEMIANRNVSGPPRTFVFIVADLTEPDTAPVVAAAHQALLRLLNTRYAPLFQSYREGERANLHVNPLLLLPAPGEPWAAEVQSLMGTLEAMQRAPDHPPPVNNIFVVGETSGGYMLSRDELASMMASFVELCIGGELAQTTAFERLLDRAADPYASFVCATIEHDTVEAARYGGRKTAIELIQWLRRTSEERTRVAQRAAEVEELFDVSRYQQLVPLEKGDAALSRVIDTQCPDFSSAFSDVGLLEDSDEILRRYDENWRDAHRQRIEAAARELGLFRIDEIIEEVEVNGAALLAEERARLDAFVDEKLENPGEGNVADAALSLRHLRKRLAAEQEAVERRATAPLRAGPDVKRFDSAYARFRKALDEKPRRARLYLWGVIAWVVATVGLAWPLRQVANVLGVDKDTTLHAALNPPWSWLTAAAIAGAIIFLLLWWRAYRTTAMVRAFVGHEGKPGELQEILEHLSRGENGSLHAFYGSRFRRACDIWVHRTLLAVLKHVDDRLARVGELLTVLELQVAEAERLQRAAEARAAAATARDGDMVDTALDAELDERVDRAGAPQRRATLRRRLVDARELPRLAADRRKPRELEDVVIKYFRDHQPFARWLERLPFADLDRIVGRCARYYDELHEQSALTAFDLAKEARGALDRYTRDFGARLDFHLDFRGHIFEDSDDLDRSLAAVCVCGSSVVDIVEESLREQDAGRWEMLATDEVGNRVRLLKLVSGISPAAIRWHIADAPSADERFDERFASRPLEVVPERGSRAERDPRGERVRDERPRDGGGDA